MSCNPYMLTSELTNLVVVGQSLIRHGCTGPCQGLMILTGQRLWNLFVNDNVDAHTAFGSGPEHVIKAVLLISRGWSTQVQLWAQPPVEDVDALSCLWQRRDV